MRIMKLKCRKLINLKNIVVKKLIKFNKLFSSRLANLRVSPGPPYFKGELEGWIGEGLEDGEIRLATICEKRENGEANQPNCGPVEALASLWPFIRFSRIFGLVPISKIGNNLVLRYPNPFWVTSGIGIFIQLLMFATSIKAILTKTNESEGTDELVEDINGCLYYVHILLNTLFTFYRIKELPKFIVACSDIEEMCRKYEKGAKDEIVKKSFYIFLFFAITQLTGNGIFLASVGVKSNSSSVNDFLNTYNTDLDIGFGNVYTGGFFCIAEFYCDMGWTFGDIFLALVSFIFTKYFQRLNIEIGKRGNSPSDSLEQLRKDYKELVNIVELFNELFSPLILLTFVGNIGYLLSRLYIGVVKDLKEENLIIRLESFYAFGFQIMKILLPSWFAAILYETAGETLDLVHNWPSSKDKENNTQDTYRVLVINRFVSQLVTKQVGVSGCGYFIINKSFLVGLVSAVLTYEVIILQFQASSLK